MACAESTINTIIGLNVTSLIIHLLFLLFGNAIYKYLITKYETASTRITVFIAINFVLLLIGISIANSYTGNHNGWVERKVKNDDTNKTELTEQEITEGRQEVNSSYQNETPSPNKFESNNKEENTSTNNSKDSINSSYEKETPVEVKRNPDSRKDYVNVFWDKDYTLFDFITDEPIFPIEKNGGLIYQIYFSTNENPQVNYGEFADEELQDLRAYKFKTKDNCQKFCDTKSNK